MSEKTGGRDLSFAVGDGDGFERASGGVCACRRGGVILSAREEPLHFLGRGRGSIADAATNRELSLPLPCGFLGFVFRARAKH